MDNPILIYAKLPYQTRDIITRLLETRGVYSFKYEIHHLARNYQKGENEIYGIFIDGLKSMVVSCSIEFYDQYRKIHGLNDKNEGF